MAEIQFPFTNPHGCTMNCTWATVARLLKISSPELVKLTERMQPGDNTTGATFDEIKELLKDTNKPFTWRESNPVVFPTDRDCGVLYIKPKSCIGHCVVREFPVPGAHPWFMDYQDSSGRKECGDDVKKGEIKAIFYFD